MKDNNNKLRNKVKELVKSTNEVNNGVFGFCENYKSNKYSIDIILGEETVFEIGEGFDDQEGWMEELETVFRDNTENVIKWADDKDLIHVGNSIKQHNKMLEEVMETRDTLIKMEYLRGLKSNLHTSFYEAEMNTLKEQLKDDLGDVRVTNIILAAQNELTEDECLAVAWGEIKDRTGKTVNGNFVKDK